jgi:proline iminopeptidase
MARRARRALAALVAVVVAAAGCGTRQQTAAGSLSPREGMLAVPGGRVWYRIAGTGPGTPLLVIHGGPGGTSCRLQEYRRLGGERPVIWYDQLGTGRSDRPSDTTLWTLPRAVEEVDAIRRALGLREVHLLGQSWGSAVATEYVLTRGANNGVRSLVLTGPFLSTPRWIEDARVLVAQLPDTVRRVIARADSSSRYDTPEYTAAMDSFAVRFGSRRRDVVYPECASVRGNRDIYRYMWGPSEFRATGTLRDYDRSARLGELRLPVLLVGGEFDEARPETVREWQRRIPGARVAIIPGAAHSMVVDDPVATTGAVGAFLREVERRAQRGAAQGAERR